ncbi:hypothetical protein K458DRAFT_436698 [Lentithecium fluviatile CBS 122367]|uniref:BTB domain-containing protein n=1 Tax=Lentithecium fluviatile CBS 122367 TaxID=1168545 RepID=A0A6G1IG59_9PLEO|nr:hypothetical protein K458DRAFT_436698 [Lentithecium fluviatile CBS 122367]
MAAEESTGQLTIGELLSEHTITVKVGPDAKEYYIHKVLLVRHSGFFRGALSSSVFQSAEDGVVTLADIETGTFDGFAYWLYYREMKPKEQWNEAYPPSRYEYASYTNGSLCATTRLTHWYVFADRFLVPDFKKLLMGVAFNLFEHSLSWYKDVIYAWANLPHNSSFLRLVVDAHCKNWDPACDFYEEQSDIQALPGPFLYQVMRRQNECSKKGELCTLREQSEYDEPSGHEERRTN